MKTMHKIKQKNYLVVGSVRNINEIFMRFVQIQNITIFKNQNEFHMMEENAHFMSRDTKCNHGECSVSVTQKKYKFLN